MPRHIVKIRDKLFLWSVVSDAPTAVCDDDITKIEKLYFDERTPSDDEFNLFRTLLARARRNGSSNPLKKNAEDFVKCNRAGPGGSELTLDQIYRVYCLGMPIDGWFAAQNRFFKVH